MTTIDLTPLYRSSIGFDRIGSLLDAALRGDSTGNGYPPYNIELTGEDRYAITLAVAGFDRSEIEIQVENGVLKISGRKQLSGENRKFLHQGIATRSFERKFNLADHVQVVGAELVNGLLNIELVRELPEAMKPRTIPIAGASATIEHERAIERGHATDEAA